MDCKVVPSESVVTQHKLLILDVGLEGDLERLKIS